MPTSNPKTVRELRSEMMLDAFEAQSYLRRISILAEETSLAKYDRNALDSALDAIDELCNRLSDA